MRIVSKSATFLATQSVNSAPFKRRETEVQIFWQGKAQNSSPIQRCTFLARRSAKLIANFSATMVTSLPSFSLSLYLSLSLSPNVPHAQYRKRFRASYNTDRERERGKWRHHCRAKIGDEFTFSLAKNSHIWRWAYTFAWQKFALFVSPFTLPVSPFTERSPLWRWNSQWVHTYHCQKFFRPRALFPPLFQMARAARLVIENPRQKIKSCPVLFCSSHRKTESN